ncbi:MAG: CARDB domain-containing protein [Flavobacteriales bacterium]
MKRYFVIIICQLSTIGVFADSPLTSTFFAMAYNDVPVIGGIMQRRMSEGIYNIPLNTEYVSFLDNAAIPLDQKIALINGLGWGDTTNTETYISHLMNKYALSRTVMDSLLVYRENEPISIWHEAEVISDHDLVCLTYIHIMGDYFDMTPVASIAEYAFYRMMDSQAAAVVEGLLVSQMMLDINWCGVYHGMDNVRELTFTRDLMRPGALITIFDYIDLYAESCEEEIATMDDNALAGLGRMVLSADYYTTHPCYTKPASRQLSTKDMRIDLKLMNEQSGKEMIYNNWITYNEEVNGSDIKVTIKNTGNETSISTNMLLHVFSDEYTGNMYLQTEIPPVKAGNTIELTLTLRDYWIYDPDAHFEIILDYDNNIEESEEDNNTGQFYENG